MIDAGERGFVSTLKNLWPYMWPQSRPDLKRKVFYAFLCMVFAKTTTVFVPYVYKLATDKLVGEAPVSSLESSLPLLVFTPLILVVTYNLMRVLTVGLNQLRDGFFASVGQHAVRQLSNIVFAHLHQLSLRFHLERRTGGLSRVIERGTKGINSIVRFSILSGVPTLFEFLLIAIMIWYWFNLTYVLVIVVMVVAYVFFTVRTSNWRIGIRRELNRNDTDAHSKVVDSLLNFETVKYFGNEKHEADRFGKAIAKYEKAAILNWTSLTWLNFGQSVIMALGLGTCMAMSAKSVESGEQSIGDFVMINALLVQLFIPLNFIGFLYREIRQGFADVEEMFRLLNVTPEVQDASEAVPIVVGPGQIQFENVSFHYTPDRKILKNISFEIPAGKTVAVVGPSGAGKSTLSRLLFRFYDVTDGKILIDGQDIRSVTQDSLRSKIGMVPQDTVLFNDTIAYNIGYGCPSSSQQQIEVAAEMAQISGFIQKLPAGFETEVGERGLKLSGGEKQRVAIARTLLKAPPILILDEATSALDTQTENEIQAALDEVSKNRTTLIIAHRLSTVVNADRILVLDDGRIVEQGTHSELVQQKGLYAEMWGRQQELSEAERQLREVQAKEKMRLQSAKNS
ncbi:MAG: ABC transporter ATP-binding protein/permease [Planctomycetota bacterium]